MRRVITTLVAFLTASATTAAEPGFYGGVGVGLVNYDVGLTESITFVTASPFGGSGAYRVPAQTASTDGDALGWSVMIGYRVHRYFATELSYVNFGKIANTESYTAPGASRSITSTQDIEVHGATVSALGTLPLGETVDLFLRGGVLLAEERVQTRLLVGDARVSASDHVWLAGIGADFSLGARWVARVEYQLTDELDEDAECDVGEIKLQQVGVTAAYRF